MGGNQNLGTSGIAEAGDEAYRFIPADVVFQYADVYPQWFMNVGSLRAGEATAAGRAAMPAPTAKKHRPVWSFVFTT